MKKLSHFDAAGSPRMVDVSAKPETRRTSRAHAFVRMRPAVLRSKPRLEAVKAGAMKVVLPVAKGVKTQLAKAVRRRPAGK